MKYALSIVAALILLAAGLLTRFLLVQKELDVVYREVDGQKLMVDIYQPYSRGSALRPAMLLVHGGGWAADDRKEASEIGVNLARKGYVAFAIDYRLVEETRNFWPAQLDDVQYAVRWVRAHAAAYGIDPERLGALGGSAGGHLVACLGTMPSREVSEPALAKFSTRPTCVIMLCGPTDLSDDFAPKVKEGAWTNEVMRSLLGHPPDYVPAARGASPLFFVTPQSSPTLIFQGKTDSIVPLDQATRFAAALQAAGVEHELVLHAGGHGFEDFDSIKQFILKSDAFLKTQLKKP